MPGQTVMTSEDCKVVSPTHWPPLATGDTPGTHFVRGLVTLSTIAQPENTNDPTGSQTLYLPAYSAMSQPTAPPRAKSYLVCFKIRSNLSD